MDTGIDLLAENLLGTLDRQSRHLLTQDFTGLDGLLLGLGLGSGDDLVAFFGCAGLGFFDDALGTALGISQARGGLVARRGQLGLDTLVGGGEFGLGLVGGGEARSSRAFVIGGHTNFIVNHTRIAKTMACRNRVALMFTAQSFRS
jgi:hypothetical protein